MEGVWGVKVASKEREGKSQARREREKRRNQLNKVIEVTSSDH